MYRNKEKANEQFSFLIPFNRQQLKYLLYKIGGYRMIANAITIRKLTMVCLPFFFLFITELDTLELLVILYN